MRLTFIAHHKCDQATRSPWAFRHLSTLMGLSLVWERTARDAPKVPTEPLGFSRGVPSAFIASRANDDFLSSDREIGRVFKRQPFGLLNYHHNPSPARSGNEYRTFLESCSLVIQTSIEEDHKMQVMENARASWRMHASHL